MNKKDKEEVAACKKLVRSLKKGYGANCPELNIECGSCKAQILIAHLEWHIDNMEWPIMSEKMAKEIENKKIEKKIKKNINKIRELIKTPLNGKVKKSKAVGKF